MKTIAVQRATTEDGLHEAEYYGFAEFGCKNYRAIGGSGWEYLLLSPVGTDRLTWAAKIKDKYGFVKYEKCGFRSHHTAIRWLIKLGLQPAGSKAQRALLRIELA